MSATDAASSYEDLRSRIVDLEPAGTDQRRALVWCSGGGVIAASRGVHGEPEIFILGPPLTSSSDLVLEVLSHDTWKRDDGSTITASRFVFPPADPFDAVTAFLCTELLRNGVDSNPQKALTASEPLIETVLQRLRLQSESAVGLLGELLVILQLIRADPSALPQILDSWHGATRSARDLQLAGVGVEVKTTRKRTSTHEIEGIRQVEIGHAVGGVSETFLYLVSLGLEPAVPGAGHTLPGVVDALLSEVRTHAPSEEELLSEKLLGSVTAYGSVAGEGYDHELMKDRAIFQQGWNVAFCRTYDMADPAVLVLRTSDVSSRLMVQPDTIQFRVNLPEQVTGDANPTVGLPAMAERILRAIGTAPS